MEAGAGLSKAIAYLHAWQLAESKNGKDQLSDDSQDPESTVLSRTLALAREREQQFIRGNDGFLRYKNLRFDPQVEQARFQLTRDIIRRSQPGEYEDPKLLEKLARHAASIEMILRYRDNSKVNEKAARLCDRIILGTLRKPAINAESVLVSDAALVVIYRDLIDLIYQFTEAVLMAMPVVTPKPGVSRSLSAHPELIKESLEKNRRPLHVFGKALHRYLLGGTTPAYQPPGETYDHHLSLVVNLYERFVIAHEYGHALLQQVGPKLTPGFKSEINAWQMEYQADIFAYHMIKCSGWDLDHIAPNMLVGSVHYFMTANEIIQQARDILTTGEVRNRRGSISHPPLSKRLQLLEQLYKDEFGDSNDIFTTYEPVEYLSDVILILWENTITNTIKLYKRGNKLNQKFQV